MTIAIGEVRDLVFEAEIPEGVNPWREPWKGIFISEQGTVCSVPGFYDGNWRWVCRFSATEPGIWTYRIIAGIDELNDRTGSLHVRPANEDDQPAACSLRIDPANPQRLCWSDGTPYFLTGFECDWLALLDHDSEGIPRAEKLIASIAANGFNHVVMNVYARDTEWGWVEGRGGDHDYADPDQWPFGGNADNPDYATLNPVFFRKLDAVVKELGRHSIVCHLMIYVWNKKVPWPKIGSAADDAYFDHVIARYQAFPNILWDISKEALLYGNCTEEFIAERCRRVRSLDAYNRLVTVHDRGFCERRPGSVDIISTQTWSSDLHTNMKNLALNFVDKPVYNIEHGGYEESPLNVFPGDYINAEVCLERNYQCVFAGVYSTYYWQGCSWNIVYHDIEALPETDRPRFDYFLHMANFFSVYPYADYVVLEKNFGSSGFWLQHRTERRLLLYKPSGNYACHCGTGSGSPFEKQLPENITWFNVLNGEFRKEPFSGAGWLEFRSPWGSGPAIAVIEQE